MIFAPQRSLEKTEKVGKESYPAAYDEKCLAHKLVYQHSAIPSPQGQKMSLSRKLVC
jgi:hypothetical protein